MWKFASNEPCGKLHQQEWPVNGERHQDDREKRNRPRIVAVVTVVTWDGAHSCALLSRAPIPCSEQLGFGNPIGGLLFSAGFPVGV